MLDAATRYARLACLSALLAFGGNLAISTPSWAGPGPDSIMGSGTLSPGPETFKIDARSTADSPLTGTGRVMAVGSTGMATAVVTCLNVVDSNDAYVGLRETSGPNPGLQQVALFTVNSPDKVITFSDNASVCANPSALTNGFTQSVTSGGFSIADA